ncbi:MAG: hypothetical protein JWQ34_2272 [Mucilaginibacter sp.]|uniref:DUF2975 domain-containing protein n=1 Tax=Mucilaginibacter sp. TaxID=1882438 RepID=UPI00262ABB51|nr:DUF2975 domain-containing protein [Mucilaginibacter sp.]MDB5004047.1 hypothetical protein [Mucilaginibacter sp.]
MKTNSNWLLKTIRVLLNIIWVLNFVFIALALTLVTFKFCTSDFSEINNPVKYTSHTEIIKMTALTPTAKDITITNDQGILRMKLKNTFSTITIAYFFFMAFEVLVTTIIYQLRKFFDTIKDSTPFQYDNIRRLKIIALCFALLTPVHILVGLCTAFILHTQIKDFSLLNMVWTENLRGLIMGAVIYVMADVFNYGFSLQKENEEFV